VPLRRYPDPWTDNDNEGHLMTNRLEGKVAIVTWGGSGIGAAIVTAFCAEGARVVVADISGGQDTIAERLADQATAVHADVTSTEDVRALVETALNTYGRLDVACNNVGNDGAPNLIADIEEEDFDATIEINLRTLYLGMRH
jgi:NAD(P)-dependent dehydrogenase (short-subunit alcohol dehydrogenase family)